MSEQDDITYGRLLAILEQLGYSRDEKRSAAGHVTLAHSGYGRPITLPVFSDSTRVHKIFLVAIRGGFKLSIPEELGHFDRLLMEAGSRLFEYASVT